MEEAIKLAIEKGGYEVGEYGLQTLGQKKLMILDPLFWQALGRALGWASEKIDKERWLELYAKQHALRYFELKLINGDEKQFWNNLLKSQD